MNINYRDIFGLFIRMYSVLIFTWGAYYFCCSLKYLTYSIFNAFGANFHLEYSVIDYWPFALPAMGIGLLCFNYAEKIVSLAYDKKA